MTPPATARLLHTGVARGPFKLAGRPRLRAALITGGIALGVLLVAFVGGVISGKLEHTTTYHGTGSLPPVVTTSSTIPAPAIAAIKVQLVEDMSLDVESQRLDADLTRRAALAETAAAIAARHNAITTAWAPDKAHAVEVQYDRAVLANARNKKAPSVLHATFIVTTWTDISVTPDTATAILKGHYQLTEPGSVVNQADQVWTIILRLTKGRWQLEERSAV